MKGIIRVGEAEHKGVLKKWTIVVLMLVCVGQVSAADAVVMEMRKLYYRSYNEKAAADKLYKETRGYDAKQPLMLGYKAVAGMMMCNYITNPYTKLKYFYAGKGELEKAIKESPADVELRYLRYAVQENVPGVLHYNSNMNEDRGRLVSYLLDDANRQIDPDLYSRIMKYMLNSNTVPAETKKKISSK